MPLTKACPKRILIAIGWAEYSKNLEQPYPDTVWRGTKVKKR